MLTGAEIMLSVFIRDPQFQSQTKDRLTSPDAARLVENAVRDHFDHFLADHMERGRALLGFVLDRMDERLQRRAEREIKRKTATSARKLRLPGKLTDCANDDPAGHRIVHRRGRQRRRIGQAGARPQDPGDPADPRQDPQRRLRDRRQDPRQSGDRRPDPGARLRRPRQLQSRRSALRADRDHDRRRRRRRPYRDPADDLLLPGDARAGRGRASSSSPSRRSTGSPPAARSPMPATRRIGPSSKPDIQGQEGRGVALQGPRRDEPDAAARDHDGSRRPGR